MFLLSGVLCPAHLLIIIHEILCWYAWTRKPDMLCNLGRIAVMLDRAGLPQRLRSESGMETLNVLAPLCKKLQTQITLHPYRLKKEPGLPPKEKKNSFMALLSPVPSLCFVSA